MASENMYIKKDDAAVLEETIRGYINEFFPNAEIQYFT